MIAIPDIHNDIERECTEYVTKYIPLFTNLRMKPLEELNYYRKTNKINEILIVQPPYRNNAGNIQYNDLSIISKSESIDIRYEFASLNVKTTLKGKILDHAFEAHNIPEQLLILVFLGEGYKEIIEYTLRPKIIEYKLPISIIESIEEYKKHIDYLFRKRW